LILLYVQYEVSYDNFHSKGDRIYRVLRETRSEDGTVTVREGISGPFAPALMKDFTEVESAVRFRGPFETWTRYEGTQRIRERRLWMAVEPDFFTIFDFEFIWGDPKTALPNPSFTVISEAVAKQYFDTDNPMGKIISREGGGEYGHKDLVVNGVVKVPENTRVRFDLVAHAATFNDEEWTKTRWERWDAEYHARPFGTYILLRGGVDAKALEAKLPNFMERYMGSETRAKNRYHHLGSFWARQFCWHFWLLYWPWDWWR